MTIHNPVDTENSSREEPVLRWRPSHRLSPVRLVLMESDLQLFGEALDSHAYWQVSAAAERRDGFIYYPEIDSDEFKLGTSEDQERWTLLHKIEKLRAFLQDLVPDGVEPQPCTTRSLYMGREWMSVGRYPLSWRTAVDSLPA